MKVNITIIFAVLLAVVLGCSSSNQSTTSTKTQNTVFNNPSNLQNLITQKIGKKSTKWSNIDFDKIENNAITIHLNYIQMPSGMREVETDTKRIAQAVLDVLVAQNYRPKDEWLALFVHAQKRETGATGTGLTRRFGKTSYDFNNDTLSFEPITK